MTLSIAQQTRFWAKVDRSGECWKWTASRHKFGYGWFNVDGRAETAHRLSWELHNGPIPAGLRVLHKCDNPPCVRPDHLYLGTQADNMRDVSVRDRSSRGVRIPQAKLTDAAVRAIRSETSVSIRDMAERYGVSRSLIEFVRNHKIWRHVA